MPKHLLSIFLLIFLLPLQKDKMIVPDDYPIRTELMRMYYELHRSHTKPFTYAVTAGSYYDTEDEWYTNSTIGQTLFISLYTDLFKSGIYHFMNNDIPDEIVRAAFIESDSMQGASKEVDFNTKKKAMPLFIAAADTFFRSLFVSNKGIWLGMPKDKALLRYGKPDSVSTVKGMERYKWSFVGDHEFKEYHYPNPPGKPVAKDSWGYSVTMYFRKGKLVAHILYNSFP